MWKKKLATKQSTTCSDCAFKDKWFMRCVDLWIMYALQKQNTYFAQTDLAMTPQISASVKPPRHQKGDCKPKGVTNWHEHKWPQLNGCNAFGIKWQVFNLYGYKHFLWSFHLAGMFSLWGRVKPKFPVITSKWWLCWQSCISEHVKKAHTHTHWAMCCL